MNCKAIEMKTITSVNFFLRLFILHSGHSETIPLTQHSSLYFSATFSHKSPLSNLQFSHSKGLAPSWPTLVLGESGSLSLTCLRHIRPCVECSLNSCLLLTYSNLGPQLLCLVSDDLADWHIEFLIGWGVLKLIWDILSKHWPAA